MERKVSPHWPGIGNYIGVVGYEEMDFMLLVVEEPWQQRRVYQDELNYINNYKEKK